MPKPNIDLVFDATPFEDYRKRIKSFFFCGNSRSWIKLVVGGGGRGSRPEWSKSGENKEDPAKEVERGKYEKGSKREREKWGEIERGAADKDLWICIPGTMCSHDGGG